MKTSCSLVILLISSAFVYDATLAGLFSTRKRKAPSNCLKPPYLGRCNRTINAWYFDPTKGWCKMFTYGPCGGGANNFRYELECLRHCRQKRHPKMRCSLPANARQCRGSSRHWYFDTITNTCRLFQGNLCADNANGFSSCEKCLYRCSSKKAGDVCVKVTVQNQTGVWLPPQQSQATGVRNQAPNIPPYSGQAESPRGWQGIVHSPTFGVTNRIPTFPPYQGRPGATNEWPGSPYSPNNGVINTKPSPPSQETPSSTHEGWYPPRRRQDQGMNRSPTWRPNQEPFQFPGRQSFQPYLPSHPEGITTPVAPPASNGKPEIFNTSMYAALTPI
ncbi:hypothetical protein MRX96_030515 [Rhipicephalus microplus]